MEKCLNEILKKLKAEKTLKKIKLARNVEGASLTTIKAKSTVGCVIYPKNENELVQIVEFLEKESACFIVMGGGSNLLFTDKAKELIAVSMQKLSAKPILENGLVTFSTGMKMSDVYKFCQENSLGGFEKVGTIPGTIGGGLYMNASAYGQSISDHFLSAKIFENGQIKKIDRCDINFSYRSGLRSGVIISATFTLPKGDKQLIQKTFIRTLLDRSATQPKGYSGGSVFKNPPGQSAGQLIEKAGLKGLTLGGAFVSHKHANFIINYGTASGEDIKKLIEIVQEEVNKRLGIQLETELIII